MPISHVASSLFSKLLIDPYQFVDTLPRLLYYQRSDQSRLIMQTTPTIYKSFIIAGNTYTVRHVQDGDFDVNLTHCTNMPDATPTSVNFGLKPNNKILNLWGIYDTDDSRSSAFVATMINGQNQDECKRVGFAMYAKNRENYSHEFYISVDQSLKKTNLPAQLFSVIVQHATRHGVKVLFCHSDESNQEMQALAKQAGMLVTLESGQSHGIKYTLMLDKQPDIEQALAL